MAERKKKIKPQDANTAPDPKIEAPVADIDNDCQKVKSENLKNIPSRYFKHIKGEK